MKLNQYLPLPLFPLMALLGGLFFGGCQVLGSDSNQTTPCESLKNSTYKLTAINDKLLPYESYNIDANNNSYVTGGSISFSTETNWNSVLINKKKVNGESSINNITREGTYTCEEGSVSLQNNSGNSTNGSIEGDIFSMFSDGFAIVYEFKKQ